MSGGTDSSVAALLLQDAGYEVTGVTFRFYEKEGDTEYLDDARTLCERLKIKHISYDVRNMFRETIIDYFIREYMAGHTPVPCTLCNNNLKWPLLQQLADELGIYHFATGHYVRKRFIDGFYHITAGADPDKDQSFFLWGLPQDILQRMLLPMGELTKIRVREIAEERGFFKKLPINVTVWAFVFARWTIARFYAANYRRTASAPENSSMKRETSLHITKDILSIPSANDGGWESI